MTLVPRSKGFSGRVFLRPDRSLTCNLIIKFERSMTIQMSGYHVVSCPTRKHQTKKHITLISTSLLVLPNEASPSYTERDIGSLERAQILTLSLHYTRFRYQCYFSNSSAFGVHSKCSWPKRCSNNSQTSDLVSVTIDRTNSSFEVQKESLSPAEQLFQSVGEKNLRKLENRWV
jgi:hypothetical protein